MLSLALSVLVFLALAMAINLHLRVTNVGREDMERAQLARALLRIIGDDLRSAVWYVPEEVSVPSLPEITDDVGDSAPGEGGAGGQGGSGGQGGGGGRSGGSGEPPPPSGSSGGDSGSAGGSSEASDDVLPPLEGLYGDQYSLQLDVSRLPRPEQYPSLASQDTALLTTDVLGEMRTVTYYLGALTGTGATVSGSTASGTGLSRRERDRAVHQWSAEMGSADLYEADAAPLADEVIGLEFRYFDGTEWVYEWDSDARQGLPMAVEVAIAIGTAEAGTTVVSLFDQYQQASAANQTYAVYRLLVHLPTAEPTTLESESTSSASSTPEESGAGASP